MTITVEVSNRQRRFPIDTNWIQTLALRVLSALIENLIVNPDPHLPVKLVRQLGQRGILSLSLVSDRQIKVLNKKWRQVNVATDVLSFPLGLEPPPVGLPWELGEVIISMEKAQEQADSYGHSLEREVAFLFAHGALHVLGFDHEVADDEIEMFGRQKKILDAAGYKR